MNSTSAAVRPARRASWFEAAGVAAIAAGIIWFYAYLATSHVAHPLEFNKGATDYYHYLVDGFREGHLWMTVVPDPELATLADPYDPAARVKIGHPGLADASYYNGHYYLYFGVAPAVTLFLPFKILTGLHFPETLACALFCAGGFLASLAIFLGIRGRYFPNTPAVVVWLGTLMLGLGNFCAVMLTRSAFYEVPISSAYFFSCLSLWALFRVLHAASFGRRWLWLASAAFGLAVASRPHFVLACPILAVVGFWRWREYAKAGQAGLLRTTARDAIALGLPLTTAVVGLLVYNYQRFGSPLDFGQIYQLGGSNQPKMTLTAWRAIPVNLYYYFFAPAQFGRYFPFVDVAAAYPGTVPKVYYGIEDPFGALINMPCYWLSFLAPVLWFVRYRACAGLGRFMVLCAGCFAAVGGFTLFFVSATNRYMVDFLPSLLLVAAVGLLMAADLPILARGRRRALHAGVALAVVASGFFGAMAAFQHNGLFRVLKPADFDRIGRWFNLPAAWWEKWVGYKYGPVELTVKLSRSSLGTNEPLVVTGTGARADYVYLFYTGNDSVQVGFTHMGSGPAASLLSEPIPLDYDVPHRIGIEEGSLYPPSSHPYFSRMSAAEVHAAKTALRVTVDGVPYVSAESAFNDASPGFVSFGHNHISGGYAGSDFKGQLMEVRRTPLTPAISPFSGGAPVLVAFSIPAGQTGKREPLVATGAPGAGDLLFIEYEDESHVRLGFHHAGSEPILSDPLAVPTGQVQRLEVSLGSFYPNPTDAAGRELARALFAKLNDRLVWAEPAQFHPPGADAPALGRNSWGSDAGLASFTGRIVAVQTAPPLSLAGKSGPFNFETYWLEEEAPAYGPLRMHVKFPADQAGKFEPLLVTGPTVSQADYVWIQYVDANRVTIGYENTGGGGPRDLIPVDLSRPHVIELSVPSLYPPANDVFFAGRSFLEAASDKNRARIVVDGVMRIDARVKAFESSPGQSTPGENRVSTTFGTRFTGRIEHLERGTFAPPAGFVEQTGPMELELAWPEVPPAGKREVILATGSPSAADRLLISYEGAGQARLIAEDHRGGRRESGLFALDPAARHVLRIGWDGFQSRESGKDGDTAGGEISTTGRAAISLDGVALLETPMEFSHVKPQNVWIGGALAPDGAFSGLIHAVRRLPSPKP